MNITPYKLGEELFEWKYTVVGFPTSDTPYAWSAKAPMTELAPAWNQFRLQFERKHSCCRVLLVYGFLFIFLRTFLVLNKLLMGTDDVGKDATGGLTLVALALATVVWIGGTILGSYVLMDVCFRNNIYQWEFQDNLKEYGYNVQYSSSWVTVCCHPSVHGILVISQKNDEQVTRIL